MIRKYIIPHWYQRNGFQKEVALQFQSRMILQFFRPVIVEIVIVTDPTDWLDVGPDRPIEIEWASELTGR